jgi:hypothetical protein
MKQERELTLELSGEDGEIHRVSNRAIFLAYNSLEANIDRLTAMLYFYNRVPLSYKWFKRFPTNASLQRFLGLQDDGTWPASKALQTADTETASTDDALFWRRWTLSGHRMRRGTRSTPFKLYLCPAFEKLPDIISAVDASIEKSDAIAIKLGNTISTLLRPDKLIIYFHDLKSAVSYGRSLCDVTLCGQVQAAPFTYSLCASGLVSLGFDPPRSMRWLNELESISWRLWVSNCIAKTIVRIRASKPSDPIAAIRGELRTSHIDADVWRPLAWARSTRWR